MSQIQVFISYAREDYSKVIDIKNPLINSDIRPWIDVDNILPGENWDLEIRKALEKSSFVIVCLSKRSVNKRGYLQKEVGFVFSAMEELLDDDIYVIPILLEPCDVPRKFENYQWLNKYQLGWESQLIKSIEKGARERGLNFVEQRIVKDSNADSVDLDDLGGGKIFSSLSLKKLFRTK